MHNKATTHIHFVGIGGIGMSGIAEVLLREGFRVSGSDLSESDLTRRLAGLGARITIGHRPESVHGATVVVISSAVKPSNPELIEAGQLRIPVIPRAEMLAEIMRGKTGIAVAGTHGKTTTTSMIATVLTCAGLDPTLIIGGKVDSLGGNAKTGKGPLMVAEADESDGSFLRLPATWAVVTNIDNDHLDYYKTPAAIDDAFVAFVSQLPIHGKAAVCLDDPGIRRCLSRFKKPVVTYGFSKDADLFATELVSGEGLGQSFEVRTTRPEPRVLGTIRLQVPGMHNVLNALAAVAIGLELGLSFSTIAAGLERYAGVKRRFEVRWQDLATRRMIVDDYGHHPTEIAATLAAARASWKGRIVVVFQPHRYSRTLHCKEGFLNAFTGADVLNLVDIYPAGEEAIPGVSSEALASEIRRTAPASLDVRYVGPLAAAGITASREFRDGDLLLCLGAGSITTLADVIASRAGA